MATDETRAELLAEALKDLITWIPSAGTYRRLGFDPEAPMWALEKARAALKMEQAKNEEIDRLRASVAELEYDLSTSEGIRARIRELEAEIDMLTSELEVVEEAEAEEGSDG